MAKKKKVARKRVSKKKVVKGSSWGKHLLLGFLMLLFKVLSLAFIVQGFILQFGSGVLYKGMVHYLIGVLFWLVALHLKKRL
tara:strand:- start:451 stop:696 length:246 start_codon:yes stop_codon:yes gene_type:complete